MKVIRFKTTQLETNTYLVIGESGRAFVVDPGDGYDEITAAAKEQGTTVEAVLLTHGHFDHTNAALFFQNAGATVFIHALDADKLNSYKSLALWAGVKQNKLLPDVTLCGGEILSVAGLKVRVIHTPGHSQGGVCYVVGDAIFCGDTLFQVSYGRTDFYDGDFSALKNSVLNKIFNLSGNYTLYTGHGEISDLDFERRNNPILTD